jgi:4-hydroxy-2-oxoheptanedioate aldolase
MSYMEISRKPGYRENRLSALWKEGKPTSNGWLAIPDPCCAEAMAQAGWDSVTIDMQHGLIDYSSMVPMLIALSTTPVVPLVRVPWLEESAIMKALDAGAYGIICPMVNTKAEAERFALACRYAPRGIRSFGPVRAKTYAGDDYENQANDTVLTIAMIETRTAVDNLEAILGVEEIQAVYIGPSDLSIALGRKPGFDQTDPVVLEAITHIITTTKKAGKRVGIHNGSVPYAARMVELGADFVTIGSDLRFLTAGAQQVVDAFRKVYP